MKKKELIHVGTFGKPLGLSGEIKIIHHTTDLQIFDFLKNYMQNEEEDILNFSYLRIVRNKLIGKLSNCNNRNCSEQLKNKKILVNKKNLPKTKKNQYYIFDLINFKVITSKDKLLGTVISIVNFGASDLINVKTDNRNNFYIPINEENIKKIDVKKKIIVANPIKGLIN